MRVGYIVLATIATLLASVNATEPASTASIGKKKFSITSPEGDGTLDGVFVQSGGEKFLILRLGEDVQSEESSTNDGQEERAGGVSASTVTKLSKQFSGKYDTVWNKFWWRVFHAITPSNRRLPDPPKVPARMRARNFAPKVDG